MSEKKKENLFASLGRLQTAKALQEESASPDVATPEADTPPSPAPADTAKIRTIPRTKPEPVRGKRQNPDYCQANCYVPKKLRKAIDRALLDIEDLDYSSLVEELLRKWLTSRGLSD
jgi:hypothetical protein